MFSCVSPLPACLSSFCMSLLLKPGRVPGLSGFCPDARSGRDPGASADCSADGLNRKAWLSFWGSRWNSFFRSAPFSFEVKAFPVRTFFAGWARCCRTTSLAEESAMIWLRRDVGNPRPVRSIVMSESFFGLTTPTIRSVSPFAARRLVNAVSRDMSVQVR